MSISDDEVEAACKAYDEHSSHSANWFGIKAALAAAAKVRAIRDGDGEVAKPGWAVVPQAILDRWLDGYAFNDDSEEDCALFDQYRASMRPALAASPIPATGGEKE